jgi:hypothetical protein
MTSLDGEYRLVGRMGAQQANVFTEYGVGTDKTVTFNGGGRQDVEFVDGLRFSVISNENFTMNVDFFSPIPPTLIPPGMKSLCKQDRSEFGRSF